MKSGTSYLQHVLSTNKDQLLERGVLFPGKRWRDQVSGAADVTGIYPKGQKRSPGAWGALMDDVTAHQPSDVLISMETFAVADADAARRVVESFPDHRPRVVITARDLGQSRSRAVAGVRQERRHARFRQVPGRDLCPGSPNPPRWPSVLGAARPRTDPAHLAATR